MKDVVLVLYKCPSFRSPKVVINLIVEKNLVCIDITFASSDYYLLSQHEKPLFVLLTTLQHD